MAEAIKAAERAYNSRVHSTVRDAPNDVASKTEAGRQLRFMAMTDSAAAYQHNQKLADKRVAKLKEQKSFRTPIEGGAFGRSFNASWSGKQELDRVQSGTLVKGKNSEQLRDVKSILVVPATTGADPAVIAGARIQKDTERRQVTAPIRDRIKETLDVGERVALTTLGPQLRRFFPEGEYSRMLKGGNLAAVIGLHRDLELQEARTGQRTNYFVRRVR